MTPEEHRSSIDRELERMARRQDHPMTDPSNWVLVAAFLVGAVLGGPVVAHLLTVLMRACR
jgi:hypothetical protein